MVSYEKAQSETLTNSEFDGKTHLSGTTAQRGSTTKWPTSMPFYDTDLKKWYKNTGTESVPISIEIGAEGSAYDICYKLSTTIGDYTLTPASATATSTKTSSKLSDGFSSDTWTATGTKVSVSGGKMVINTLSTVDTDRKTVALSSAISDSVWVADFDFKWTAQNGGGAVNIGAAFGLVNGNVSHYGGSADSIIALVTLTGGVIQLGGRSYNGGATDAQTATSISLTQNTQYYCRLERTSSTAGKISVFTDSGRTVHHTNSPQTWTINSGVTGLTHAQIGDGSHDGSGSGYNYSAEVDNVSVYEDAPASYTYDGSTSTFWQSTSESNPAIYWDFSSNRKFISFAINLNTTVTTLSTLELSLSTDTTFSGEVKRTLLESDFTNNTWRYILINVQETDTRYVQLKGVGTGVLSVYEFKARATTDTSPGFSHFHKVISTTATSASSNDSN